MQPEWVIGIAIALSIFYTRKTGFSCGGIITPGLLALHIGDPARCAMALGVGVLLSAVLEGLVRLTGVYGRERLALSLLLALAARLVFQAFLPLPSPWLGWVVPGLVAADIQRQGLAGTLSAAVSVSVAAVFASDLAVRLLSEVVH